MTKGTEDAARTETRMTETGESARTATSVAPRNSSGSRLRDPLWLAGRDLRSSWASFPAMAVAALMFGLLGALQYRNALGGDIQGLGPVVLDFFLLAVVAALSSNYFFNRDYFREISDEAFNGRLSFLRGLPVPARSVVGARVAVMLLALACSAPVFFLAPYLAYGGLREFIGFVDYLWYFGIWLGYALVAVGGFVLGNFAFNLKLNTHSLRMTVVVLGLYALIVLVSNLALADGLSLSLIELAKSVGPLASVLSLVIGVSTIVLCAGVAAKRLERRDIG